MVPKKICVVSIIVSLSQLILATNGNSIDESNPMKVKLTTFLDINFDKYGRQFKRDEELIEPYVPDQIEKDSKNDVCKTLVGTSKGVCCPVDKQQSSPRKYLFRNCREIQASGTNKSGMYSISPNNADSGSVIVLCDMDTRGGGWTTVQKRLDGSEDFYRNWREYKFGFGNLLTEFWLGLENIHQLTGYEANELLVEVTDKDQVKHYAHYLGFSVGPELDGYVLKTASGFSGSMGDSMEYQLGQQFTTYDLDQDKWDTGNCAEYSMGGWWYNNCYSSNLNGKLRNMKHTEALKRKGMNWDRLTTNGYFLSGTRMLVRSNK